MNDAGNLIKVKNYMHYDFPILVEKFEDLCRQVGDLLPEDEKAADINNWVEPKMSAIRQFAEETEEWINSLSESKINEDIVDEDEMKMMTLTLKTVHHR